MQPVSGAHGANTIINFRTTSTANRATTDPIPDVTSIEPADLRSRLQGGEALQENAEAAGVESEDGGVQPTQHAPALGRSNRVTAGIGALVERAPPPAANAGAISSSAGRSEGRDAARHIEELATTMAVDTATVRQSIDDGSLSQLLAQNGVQSSIGMLFNTKL